MVNTTYTSDDGKKQAVIRFNRTSQQYQVTFYKEPARKGKRQSVYYADDYADACEAAFFWVK